MRPPLEQHSPSSITSSTLVDSTSRHASPTDSTQSPSSLTIAPGTGLKRKRGRHGCLNCRRKRKKCDELKPKCTRCTKHGDACEWDNRIIFRHSGLNGEHQAMRTMGSHATPPVGDLTIINVTSAVSQICRGDEPSSQDHQPSSQHQNNWKQHEATADSLSPYQSRPSDGVSPHARLANRPFPPATALSDSDAQRLSYIPPVTTETQLPSVRMKRQASDINTILNTENRQLPRPERMPPTDHFSTGSSLYTTPMPTPVSVPSEDAHQQSIDFVSGLPLSAGELAALDFLTSQPQSALHGQTSLSDQDKTWISPDVSQDASSAFSEQLMVESPNGLYYPSSAYRDLQQDLHTHIVETARNSGHTRHATPEGNAEGHMEHSRTPAHAETVSGATDRFDSLARHPLATGLTDQREIELWQNYLNEIAPWLDKFDNQRHFQFTIPILAKTCTHLRYSALALSARQQERKNPSRPYTESLGLYQEAIRNLVPELETMSTAVVASSVLLCVLEMIIVSPKDWGRHLDGCAILLQAANITGASGGVNQALFWCFARMDVWSGYLSDCCTKVPMDRWLSSNVPMSTAVHVFKNECKGFDAYANYAVFLSASVVNVINGRGDIFTNHEKRAEYIARWRALFDLVEDWFSSRPVEMVPLLSYPAVFDNYEFPFPKVLYGNAPATNGNQLYHFCAIRLLQEKPKEIGLGKKTGKSIIWHARQICGIAASNSHHGAWINGIQPLFVAGKLMSHPSEHRAILKVLKRIEEESGWATKWRADELREHWGTES